MKVQHIAVIFIIIILPISMILSYTIGTQIDTINLQTEYNMKLTDATYDAVKAFQINTVNNRYSSISNSKIRDIEASVATFYNSLSSNENRTKEDLQYYVPALVYTLYDGYYIYSKYDNVYGAHSESNWIPQLNEEELKKEEYTNFFGLKPYIYYACHYKKGDKDFVVNYTLDNAITVYGTFGGKAQTLSGYLIDPNKVTNVNENAHTLVYDGVQIGPELLTERLLFEDDTGGNYNYLVYNGQKIYYDSTKTPDENETAYFFYQNYKKQYVSTYNAELVSYLDSRKTAQGLTSTSSFEFYKKAQEFSSQVEDLIGDVSQDDAIDSEGHKINSEESIIQFSTNTGSSPIFKVRGNSENDPLLSSSTFNENRMSVIRYSIETNLSAAINNYNMYSDIYSYEFAMPKLSEDDWEKLTEKVSVISFLQGIPIGHKYFNDYCVITNDSNEETINKENIYIVTETAGGISREYHLPGCKYLINEGNIKNEEIVDSYANISFFRQKVRISEEEFKFFYPQSRAQTNGKNIYKYITGCYHCIVNTADVYSADEIIQGKLWGKDANWEDTVEVDVTKPGANNERAKTIRELYLRALGRERYGLYQANMDAFMENQDETAIESKGVTLSPTAVTLKVGETANLLAIVTPASLSSNIKWSSTHSNIATVSATGGIVTAKSPGTTTIKVEMTDGSKKSATCKVTVIPEPEPEPTSNWTANTNNGVASVTINEPASTTKSTILQINNSSTQHVSAILNYNKHVNAGDVVEVKYSYTRSNNYYYLDFMIDGTNTMSYGLQPGYQNQIRTYSKTITSPKDVLEFRLTRSDCPSSGYYATVQIYEIKINGVKVL